MRYLNDGPALLEVRRRVPAKSLTPMVFERG